MKIACVGGGPAGLHAATLLKESDSRRTVRVYESGRRDATFGFGVVFSDPTLEGIRRSDARLYADLTTSCVHWESIETRLGDVRTRSTGQGFSAISRRSLLELLHRRAEAAGVEIRFETPVFDPEDIDDFDIIIVADGAGSAIRSRFAKHFKPLIERGATKFIWFGTTKSFDCLTFLFERNQHGAFSVHAYPFSDEMSTFIVETDEASWVKAGLNRASEQESIKYCEELFARHLDGHGLVSNQSRWLNFRTVSNATWRHRNLLLLGDAAHTAHFSVGSGTKLAFEDAIALSREMASAPSLDEACLRFEADRSVAVARLQGSAGPSLTWWENFGRYMAMPAEQFMFHFLTRNRRVTCESLLKRDPQLVEHARAAFAGGSGDVSPPEVPLRLRDVSIEGRLVGAGGLGDAVRPLMVSRSRRERSGASRNLALVSFAEAEGRLDELADWADVLVLEPTGRILDVGLLERLRGSWPDGRPLGLRLPLEEATRWRRKDVRDAVSVGCDLLWLAFQTLDEDTDPATIQASDRVRHELGAATLVSLAKVTPDELDTILVAGRADLVFVEEVTERRKQALAHL